MLRPAILVDLDRCTGCWTCSMACKVAYKLPEKKWRMYVRTLGSGSGMDEPDGKWPDVHMSWMPIYTSTCVLCRPRTDKGKEPFCTYNCPTRCLTFGDIDDPQSPISIRLKELQGKDRRTFQLPAWENTRPEIFYSRK
jgi:Fe-S-cluster-containing dehydrogenase component